MMPDDRETPNAAQIRYWNSRGGSSWVPAQSQTDAMLGPLGQAALDAASIEPGHQVLDVGCGCGDTSLTVADMVGPSGGVVGLDVSRPMLDLARTRAQARDNVVFVQADAQTTDLAALQVDRIVSRFGVMFFEDPVAAFSNIRSALNESGRLSFVCWQPAPENPWLGFTVRAVADLLEFPPGDSAGPGPFSLGGQGRIRDVLGKAGFRKPSVTPLVGELDIVGGADLEDAVAYSVQMSPIPGMVSDDPALAATVTARVTAAFEDAWNEGSICLPYGCWVVTAQR